MTSWNFEFRGLILSRAGRCKPNHRDRTSMETIGYLVYPYNGTQAGSGFLGLVVVFM